MSPCRSPDSDRCCCRRVVADSRMPDARGALRGERDADAAARTLQRTSASESRTFSRRRGSPSATSSSAEASRPRWRSLDATAAPVAVGAICLDLDSARGRLSFYDDRGLSVTELHATADFRGHEVPDVLLSGDHKRIAAWRVSSRAATAARGTPASLLDSRRTSDAAGAHGAELEWRQATAPSRCTSSSWTRPPDTADLLTTVTDGYDRVSMHGVRTSLVSAQAAALDPAVERSNPSVGDERAVRASDGGRAHRHPPRRGSRRSPLATFSSTDVRAHRERLVAGTGLRPSFHLRGKGTVDLARRFSVVRIQSGGRVYRSASDRCVALVASSTTTRCSSRPRIR